MLQMFTHGGITPFSQKTQNFMLRINKKISSVLTAFLTGYLLSFCNKDSKPNIDCSSEEAFLTSLSIQNGAEFSALIDSLNLVLNPDLYNNNYKCLALAELKSTAPSVFHRKYYLFRTSSIDTIGYVSFDNFIPIKGVDDRTTTVAIRSLKERTYFCLLRYLDKGVHINAPFFELEHFFDYSYCNLLNFKSITFSGMTIDKNQLKVSMLYNYSPDCEGAEDKHFEKEFIIPLDD